MKVPFRRAGATDAAAETEAPAAGEESTSTEAPEPAEGPTRKRRFGHVQALFAPVSRVLAKIPHPPWRSKRGIFVLFVLVAGFGGVATVGGTTAVHYSETASFCGLCHTMDPELKAYAMSPHKEVTCGECHINPGLGGFVKAKLNGTKQLLGIVTGVYPTPIPPPDHATLPPVRESCLKCHELDKLTENGGPVKLVLRPRYRLDETNTRETVAILLRPAGLGETTENPDGNPEDVVKGVHWHIEQQVTYTSPDEHSRKIDLVEIKAKDGTTKQYISQNQVSVSTDATPDIARLKSGQHDRLMDCADCHNRVGHGVASPERVVDEAMASGKISATLPFIKRDSVALLNGDYPSLEAADKAIAGLGATYAAKYPLVAKTRAKQVTAAIGELKTQYRLIATPAMKVQAKTYPDNLGHQSSPGCFRCHDGAHHLVVKGQITNKTIPSECSTCHTFPQIGGGAPKSTLVEPATPPVAAAPARSAMPSQLADFPLGARPANHKDALYTFNHKNATKSLEPAGTSCDACHTRTYCVDCHNSGAVDVTHDNMLYDHASIIRTAKSTQSCAYCHQAETCKTCHNDKPVLSSTLPATIKARPQS